MDAGDAVVGHQGKRRTSERGDVGRVKADGHVQARAGHTIDAESGSTDEA